MWIGRTIPCFPVHSPYRSRIPSAIRHSTSTSHRVSRHTRALLVKRPVSFKNYYLCLLWAGECWCCRHFTATPLLILLLVVVTALLLLRRLFLCKTGDFTSSTTVSGHYRKYYGIASIDSKKHYLLVLGRIYLWWFFFYMWLKPLRTLFEAS